MKKGKVALFIIVSILIFIFFRTFTSTIPVDPNPVTHLTTIQQPTQWAITSQGETLALTNLNDRWELKNQQDYPLNQSKVLQLITKWKEVKTSGIVQDLPEDKVQEEVFTIHVSDLSGKEESFQFLSGTQDAFLCKKENEDITYLVNRQDVTGFQIQKENLLELAVMPTLTEEDIQSVTIQQGEQVLVVQKETTEMQVKWSVSDSMMNQVVSSEQLHDFFSALINLKINRCLSVTSDISVLQQVGLDLPQAKITISYMKDLTPKQLTLEIGNDLADLDERVIRFEDSKLIETTNKKSIDTILSMTVQSVIN